MICTPRPLSNASPIQLARTRLQKKVTIKARWSSVNRRIIASGRPPLTSTLLAYEIKLIARTELNLLNRETDEIVFLFTPFRDAERSNEERKKGGKKKERRITIPGLKCSSGRNRSRERYSARSRDFTAGTRNRDSSDTGPGVVLTVLISQARDLVPSATQTARDTLTCSSRAV